MGEKKKGIMFGPYKNFPVEMTDLIKLLKKEKIKFIIRQHPNTKERAKELIGYNPSGDWQVIIDKKFSVIRGMASLGWYEIMRIKYGVGEGSFAEPERFDSAKNLIKAYKQKG